MTPKTRAQRGAPAALRSRLYWLMAGWLLAPNDGQARTAMREMAVLLDDEAGTGAALGALAAALDSVESTALAVEHTRLFGGLSPSYGPPPPMESAQGGDGVATLLAVSGAYRDAGYADIDPALPDDHLAVELKFMALLALQEHEAAQRGDEGGVRAAQRRQRHFLDRHLGAWLPHYAQSIERESRVPALATAIRLLDRVIARDRALLADAEA
ncbi:MAG: hypothetical protein OHK0044_17710 [Burkholderiaceae bacterium]